MKIYKPLSLVALLAVLITSCTKSDVQPAAAKLAASTNTSTPRQTKDTIYAYSPGISGPMGATIPDSLLAGNWVLVSDSTSLTGGEKPAFDSGSKYTGQPGDFFNIASNGMISMREGSNSQAIDCVEINSGTNLFELLYTQYPNVTVVGGGFIHAQLLKPLITAHSAILTTQIAGTMGIYMRQFTLTK